MIAPPPLLPLADPALEVRGVSLAVLRTDLIHPVISGNKWYKLKYNLAEARRRGHDTLLSFGGAYSNHIHALAGAGAEYSLKTIGVIRGEEHLPLNPTLSFARDQGMRLTYLDRASYRRKHTPEILARLIEEFGDFYLIPEGGSNALAVQGCMEMVEAIDRPFDVIACACGTGATLAGLIAGLGGARQALGIAVLRGAGFLQREVEGFLASTGHGGLTNWSINLDYHFGGYARHTPALIEFITRFEAAHGIALEQVYTGKLLYGLYDLITRGHFAPGTRIVAVHSGGVQGRAIPIHPGAFHAPQPTNADIPTGGGNGALNAPYKTPAHHRMLILQ
ncbi:MAG: pyridoxal-phosphate dependent enzyme [Pseudomonadota bacterium]